MELSYRQNRDKSLSEWKNHFQNFQFQSMLTKYNNSMKNYVKR